MNRIAALACGALLAGCGTKFDTDPATGTGTGDTPAGTGTGAPATGTGAPATGTGTTATGTGTGGETGVGFRAHLVAADLIGPRHVAVEDLDGDGKFELYVSGYGALQPQEVPPGVVRQYTWTGPTLDDWSEFDVVPESAGVLYPNRSAFHDVDRDGDLDLIVPTGGDLCVPVPPLRTCGGFLWVEHQGGNTWVRHPVVEGHEAVFETVELVDLDLDGIDDLITAAVLSPLRDPVARLLWFKGTGDATGFDPAGHLIGEGAGTWQTLEDIDGDGDTDIATGNLQHDEFGWWENVYEPSPGNPNGVWAYHLVDDTRGPGHMMRFVPNLFGDGKLMVVATNHTNTQRDYLPDPWPSEVVGYTIPADPKTTWPGTTISADFLAIRDLPIFPMDAPGEVAAGDIDEDGDQDLVVAGDGDPAVYILDQTSPGTFETKVLRSGIARSAGLTLRDLNGDGDLDIVVAGQVQNVVFVIEQL